MKRKNITVLMMLSAALLGILITFIISCAEPPKEIHREKIEYSVSVENISCNKTSYCFVCAPGVMDFKLTCGLKWSNYCDGTKKVEMETKHFKVDWKACSG